MLLFSSSFTVFTTIAAVLVLALVSGYQTQMSCKDTEKVPWEVNFDHYEEYSKLLQDWIYAYHHDCKNEYKVIDHEPTPVIGIGSSFQYTTNQILWCVHNFRIHRPTNTFSFSEVDPKKCTLKMSAIDCFLKPISPCGFEDRLDSNDIDPRKDLPIHEVLANFTATHGDVCTLGRLLKKPIQWIHANFIEYLMRPRHDIGVDVDARVRRVYEEKKKNPNATSVIAVHVRDGNTYDFGRRVLNVSTYVDIVDVRAKELAARGKPVVTVFMASHIQEHNIKSSEHMNALYPRPYKFVVLPHVEVPNVPYKTELDDALSNPAIRATAPLRQMFVEYLADVEIMAQSDVFIGVTSNIYTLVAAKRIARKFHIGNDTCYIDSRSSHTPLVCEDNPQSHEIWKMYFGHLMSTKRSPDPGHGYEQGTPFFNYTRSPYTAKTI